ncbi:MAG: hypothetical protein M1825_001962 [Sarcosagium campestre]|nr:MAG: hypothetical protein M1825_001962 [Sarcosagium campestre]
MHIYVGAVFVLVVRLTTIIAYSIDGETCFGKKKEDLEAAIREMQTVALNAQDRIAWNTEDKGDYDDVQNWYQTIMGNVEKSRVIDMFARLHEATSDGVNRPKIYCSDRRLTYITPNPVYSVHGFKDPSLDAMGNYPIEISRDATINPAEGPRACNMVNNPYRRSFYYSVRNAQDAIVLCPQAFSPGAYGSPDSHLPLKMLLRLKSNLTGTEIDQITPLSMTLLHQFTRSYLDDERVVGTSEISFDYRGKSLLAIGYENCMRLKNNYDDRPATNADSFSILALGLYLDKYAWTTGEAVEKSSRAKATPKARLKSDKAVWR